MILSENDIQAPADKAILTEFLITSFSTSKIKVKVRKRPDHWSAFRGAIAPADDITLQVQPLYESCEMKRGAPQSIEIAPASEFHDFRTLSPNQRHFFLKISRFSKFGLMTTDAWMRITFFVSQRPAVILSENDIQAPADRMI